ncbi:MAG TPA: hypothetical protein VN429_07960 [Methanospirillum sp.]|uniref:hypothetical protein n=1 Tax=Methanospirillum sp. TaxID=45200 RepID=UPI002B9C2A78|nr:hypothetical protein [Methanospirillum sp.]HWQ64338.1 hypothetical protein [Methanospirillum sp.]
MSDQSNPLKNIPSGAFSIFQASHTYFHACLADIPSRYPVGTISYINNHDYVPLLRFREEDQDRLNHIKIDKLADLLDYISHDTSSILFIEYHLAWFRPDNKEELEQFCETCKTRAKAGGPVAVITAMMDRNLLSLDGKADYFFQVKPWELKGRARAIKDQTELNSFSFLANRIVDKGRLYGQMKLGV